MATPAERSVPLPPVGFGLALDPGVRWVGDGRVLLGGSPLRLLKLTEGGAAVVRGFAAGERIGRSAARRRLARRLLEAGMAHPQPPPSSSGFTWHDVTIVVPVYGDNAQVLPTLKSLAEAAVGAQIIVVDDASPTPLRDLPTGVTLLRRQRNGGPGAARQTALDVVATPLVLFVDADVVVPAGACLSRLLDHLADPAVVAVAPRVCSRPAHEGESATLIRQYELGRSPLDLGVAEGRVAPSTAVPYVPTAALLVRKTALENVGGFSPMLRYGEDVDLVWRLVRAGGVLRYEPTVVLHHEPRATAKAWLSQRFHYGSSAAALERRHPGNVAPLRVSGWSLLAWGSAAAGYPFVGVLVAVVTTARLPRKLRPVLAEPWPEALRLAGLGHLLAGRWIAQALTRSWWPALLFAAMFSRRARVVVAASALLPAVADWSPELGIGLVRYVALRVADDASYASGVWAGCCKERSFRALLPALGSWPGRSVD